MKITLTNTSRIVEVNGVPARIWEGHTDQGIAVVALVTRVAVRTDTDNTQFERELLEQPPSAPSEDALRAFPARLVLP